MAKDPAFLFYDGDAARDVSHMNRLERGCYFDILQAQRKFGRLSEDLIRKILGKDFETCWESVKISLTYDDHMYYIEWLEESINKRKSYSESRRNNRKGKKNDDMNDICETYEKDMLTHDNHMENEIENENEDININDNVKGKEEPSKAEEKKDFIEQVIEVFSEEYLKARGIEYINATPGKERMGVGKLLKQYKSKNEKQPKSGEDTLNDFRTFFNLCLKINDKWHMSKMSIMHIASNINELRTRIINQRDGNINGQGATLSELQRVCDGF